MCGVLLTVVFVFADEHRLSDYSIGPEAKLNLVVRPAGERSSGAGGASGWSNDRAGSGVWQLLSTVLAKHFSPADAAKVQEQLIKVQKYDDVILAFYLSFSFYYLLESFVVKFIYLFYLLFDPKDLKGPLKSKVV